MSIFINQDDFFKPMKLENIDVASSLIIPFFDYDTKVIFIAGKVSGIQIYCYDLPL